MTTPTINTLTINGRVTAADPQRRTVTGTVLRYGEVGDTSVGPTRFLPGSLDTGDLPRIKLLIEHDNERVIGYATAVDATGQDVVATFTVPNSPAGDAALASAAAGLRDGLSVGVQVVTADMAADGVIDVHAGRLRETSLVAVPAFPSARVSAVTAHQPPPAGTPAAPPAAPIVPAAVPPIAAAGTTTPYIPPAPRWNQRPAARTFEAAAADIAAAWRRGGPPAALTAALSDVVPPADAGQADVMFRPQWVGELWAMTQDVQRPFIDAFRSAPLTSMKVSGFRRTGRYGVAAYAGDKAAVPSPAASRAVEPIDATAGRIAGAHDVDRIFLDLGDGSFVQDYFQLQTEDYRTLSESTFEAAVKAAATNVTATLGVVAASKVIDMITAVVDYFAQVSRIPTIVALGATLWKELIGIPDSAKPWLFGGSASLTGRDATLAGVRFTPSAALAATQILAGLKPAATHYEWRNPPLSIQAVNLPNGGVDLGVFGYTAALVNDPTAIITATRPAA